MEKRNYQKPEIVRVQLVVKNAILAVCHSSPLGLSPKEEPANNCQMTVGCYNVS